MLEVLAYFLLGIQFIIFLYFIAVNSIYTYFSLTSIKELLINLKISTQQKLKILLSSQAMYRPISILVPAYNEELTILSTVKSLLSLFYPEFEIIVINDGSTDKTLDLLISEFNLIPVPPAIKIILPHKPIKNLYVSLDYPNLIVIDKVNGGKADALNAGINVSQYPIFCCIDADSILDPEALLRASRLFFEDRTVIAVGGIVLPLNGAVVEGGTIKEFKAPKKFIELFQSIEYTRGFLAGRTGWSILKSLLIISGAFGVFRKDMVISIGGYRKTVGEDMDLVVRLHKYCLENKIPYKIAFIPDPICYTQVPTDWTSLLKQRNRWHRGLIDSLLYSKDMFLNPKYKSVGIIGFPYFIFVEALGPIVEFTGYLSFIIFYILDLISKEYAFLFFCLAFVWGMWINIASVFLDNYLYRRYSSLADLIKLLFTGILEFFGYRQLIAAERIIATFQFWRKGWGKPLREKIQHEFSI
jgi:cellulose synthase/poly-beta-1,6-N-acetylglucosamine synthase-like glycosyltransferase